MTRFFPFWSRRMTVIQNNSAVSWTPIPPASPIARDALSSSYGTTATSVTYSHTCSGSNRILVVSILGTNAWDTVTGVTYAWVAMTRVARTTLALTESDYLYYLVAPSTWANNIIVTASISQTFYCDSVSYVNVKQTGQPNGSAVGGVGGWVGALATSVTTTVNDCWLVGFLRSQGSQTPNAGTTFISWVNTTAKLADSNGSVGVAGTYSLWTTFASPNASTQIVMAIAPL